MVRGKSISEKLIIVFIFTSSVVMIVNMVLFINMNRIIKQMDEVYESNVLLNEVSETLQVVQNDMYRYLSTKSSDTLESYYKSEKLFGEATDKLGSKISGDKTQMMQTNIKNMSKAYLEVVDLAVQAKRGRNITKYNEYYNQSLQLKDYISSYITTLNNLLLSNNSEHYTKIKKDFHLLELVGLVVMFAIIVLQILLIVIITRKITKPLTRLAKTANQVAKGDFDQDFEFEKTGDEIEVLSKAFKKMIISIREYIEKLRTSLENESIMKEKGLMMENHLKDAQLKYLQAQINPHFLFNSLNAGVQLAMLEDAERTSVFIENLAEFYRYNINQDKEDSTISKEINLIDHYIHILNVRFSGSIHFSKEIQTEYISFGLPAMSLQPFVENAVSHGIRNISWQGEIHLKVYDVEDHIYISIKDNGIGIKKEDIKKIIIGNYHNNEDKSGNGIGVSNVISRLRLYYHTEDIVEIKSEGENKGTEVLIKIPKDN